MRTPARSVIGAILLAVPLCMGGGGLGMAAPLPVHQAGDNSTFVIGSNFEPDTLNPLMTDSPGATVTTAVFDSLLAVDPHGRLQPDLAVSVDHSADGRTWTFHLRHDVKWSDGQPFTSADVAYNYQAMFAKGHLIGITQGWNLIDRSSTPDSYTFICHIKQVFAPFLLDVASTDLLPKHIYDRPGVDFNKASFNRVPVGTGPYMVAEWKAGDNITLVPNPYSWQGQPFFKKIIWKIILDPNTMLVQMRTGEVDMGVVNQSLVAQARTIAGTHIVSYLNDNLKRIDLKQWGFLREQVVRQALDYATPKEAIFNGISHGFGAIAYSDTAPLLKDYYNPNVPTYRFNLAKAAAMLAADGFTKGSDGVLVKGGQPFAIELWSQNSDPNGQHTNELLQQEWGQIGIKVTLHVVGGDLLNGPSGPIFSKTMTGITNAGSNGADPDDSCAWNSKYIPASPTGSGCNADPYFYPFSFQKEIDALTNAGVATVDPAKRKAIYFKIQALLANEVPAIFLYWLPDEMLTPNSLKGFVPNPFSSPLWNVATWRSV
jgi:peptide/nickel transport system substrate-binding protein